MSEQEKTVKKRRWRISRRGFLIGGGITAGTLALGYTVGLPQLRLRMSELFENFDASSLGDVTSDPLLWFEIAPDNTVTMAVPKVEMGQGIHTALAQIAAEELEVAWEQLNVVPASTTGPTDSFGTGGSFSVSGMWEPLRVVGATMRVMLVEAAAQSLGVGSETLTAANGAVSNGSQTLTYGEIVAQTTEWAVPEEAPALKPRSSYKLIGKSMPRVDFEAKLAGDAKYGLDMRKEGMLYGAVAYAPTIAGSIKGAKVGEVMSRSGVVNAMVDGDFAGVVAETRLQAQAAVNGFELELEDGELFTTASLYERVSVGNGSPTDIQREGNAKGEVKNGAQQLMAEYRTPMAAHAHLEPQAALVDVQDGRIEAWVSTQAPLGARDNIAEAMGVDPETVEVHSTYIGGGFGRKSFAGAAIEAAKLSKMAGRPVHVGWDRAREFRNGYLRPPTHHILRGSLNDDGSIHAYDHQQASGDVSFPFMPAFFPIMLGADFGATRGARWIYSAENVRTTAWRVKLPFLTGWWRALGLLANVFAVESFMDELAHAANEDPLEFRLRHLPTDENGLRLRAVLERAAEMANWGSNSPGRAKGIAVCTDVGTPVAQVAEVSIEGNQPRTHKVWCAIDPGLAINPDGISAQTQGSIMMGLSSVLFEKIELEDGRITAGNFDRYPLITMKESPDIDIDILEGIGEPKGVGEPPIGPIAAAVGNAVFSLTGQRIRDLPMTVA